MYFADAAVVKIPIINEPKQLRDRILDDFFENIPLVAACRRKLPRRVNLIGCKLEIRGAWVECPTIREEKSRHGDETEGVAPGRACDCSSHVVELVFGGFAVSTHKSWIVQYLFDGNDCRSGRLVQIVWMSPKYSILYENKLVVLFWVTKSVVRFSSSCSWV